MSAYLLEPMIQAIMSDVPKTYFTEINYVNIRIYTQAQFKLNIKLQHIVTVWVDSKIIPSSWIALPH